MEAYFNVESTQSEGNSHTFLIVLNPNHPVYKGHFPDVPVTPGVVLTDICRELTQLVCEKELQLVEAKSIKFLSMVNPLMTPKLNVKIDVSELDNVISTKIVADFDAQIYFKINADFAASK